MAVKKRAETTVPSNKIEQFINQGGKVKADNSNESVTSFLVRLSKDLLDTIDMARENHPAKLSRNQFVLAAIRNYLEVEN